MDAPGIGAVVFFRAEREQYLVRFGGGQQLYFDEAHVLGWGAQPG